MIKFSNIRMYIVGNRKVENKQGFIGMNQVFGYRRMLSSGRDDHYICFSNFRGEFSKGFYVHIKFPRNILGFFVCSIDQNDMIILCVFDEVFAGVSSDFPRTKEKDVFLRYLLNVFQYILYRSKGYRSCSSRNIGFIFDSFTGLNYRIDQALTKAINQPRFFRAIKPLLQLTDNFKVS